ncbi:MAG: hypothetical protein IT282_14605, partial [Bacteroidetes bacterium]|nr:hypothetical protein [Bacteroidota bacterium]
YVGWYPLQAGEWTAEYDPPGQAKSVTGRPEMSGSKPQERNWRFRSHKLQNGYVIEVRSEREIGSFEKFTASLRSRLPKAVLTPGKVSVEYTTLGKDRMAFTFPETRHLNGKVVDLTKTKLFEGPYLNAEVGSERLTITYKGAKRVLDFRLVRVSE